MEGWVEGGGEAGGQAGEMLGCYRVGGFDGGEECRVEIDY